VSYHGSHGQIPPIHQVVLSEIWGSDALFMVYAIACSSTKAKYSIYSNASGGFFFKFGAQIWDVIVNLRTKH